jgi:hypothetical protein
LNAYVSKAVRVDHLQPRLVRDAQSPNQPKKSKMLQNCGAAASPIHAKLMNRRKKREQDGGDVAGFAK